MLKKKLLHKTIGLYVQKKNFYIKKSGYMYKKTYYIKQSGYMYKKNSM